MTLGEKRANNAAYYGALLTRAGVRPHSSAAWLRRGRHSPLEFGAHSFMFFFCESSGGCQIHFSENDILFMIQIGQLLAVFSYLVT